MSNSRNTRMPAENAFNSALRRGRGLRSLPKGRLRKIVEPAMAPRTMVRAKLISAETLPARSDSCRDRVTPKGPVRGHGYNRSGGKRARHPTPQADLLAGRAQHLVPGVLRA